MGDRPQDGLPGALRPAYHARLDRVGARTRALRALGLVLVGALLGLVVVDRWVAWLDRHQGELEVGLLVPDERLGWINRPGYASPDVPTDSRGLRNPEVPADAPADELRILVLGDSRVHGSGVADHEVFSAVLEQRLAARLAPEGRAVRVLNAGTNSYTALQSARRGQELLPVLRPDLVLLFLSPAWPFRPNAEMGEWVTVGGRLVPGDVLAGWPSGLHGLAAAWHDRLKVSALYRRHRTVAMHGGAVTDDIRHYVISRHPPPDRIRPFLDSTHTAFEGLGRAAAAAGAEVRVVLMPETFMIAPDVWKRYLLEHADAGTPPPGTSRFEPMASLAELVERAGLPTWEFSGEIQAFMSDVDRYYQADEAHWNAVGHAAMAPALEAALDREGLLERLASRRRAEPR